VVEVSFYGVRGSTPCSCEANHRYGGNTACVVVEADDMDPIVLDLGTGLRFFGLDRCAHRPFRATALVSHLHWDHVQGLPFFTPIHHEGARLDVIGPAQGDGRSLRDAFDTFVNPPYFPVGIDGLAGHLRFDAVGRDTFEVGRATVSALPVPHIGPTAGYRIEVDGAVIAYVSDHQQPHPGATDVADEVLELCRGADVVIHDAQYTADEFELKHDWGHCTLDYAVEVAAQAEARELVLFHHDPSHDDETMDRLAGEAVDAAGARTTIESVVAAAEGMRLRL